MISYSNKKCKGFAYLNGEYVKLKKGYIYEGGAFKTIYSAGNIVTYIVDTSISYTEEIASDDSVLSPSSFTPSKSGWIFLGWREDTTASGNVLSSKVMGDEPITLYAVFTQEVTRNFISYDSEQEVTGNKYYNNGNTAKAAITVPTGATYTGWTWRGWSGLNSTAADADVVSETGKTIYTNDDGNVYGLYEKTITLTTVANGTTSTQTGTRYHNSYGNYKNPTFTVANPTKADTTFKGWSTSASSATVTYSSISSREFSSNTTLYAVFTYSDISFSLSSGYNSSSEKSMYIDISIYSSVTVNNSNPNNTAVGTDVFKPDGNYLVTLCGASSGTKDFPSSGTYRFRAFSNYAYASTTGTFTLHSTGKTVVG